MPSNRQRLELDKQVMQAQLAACKKELAEWRLKCTAMEHKLQVPEDCQSA